MLYFTVRRHAVQVLAAALITERGFSKITLDLVAQKAGVTKGGLIHHFPNKQVLLEELCREVIKEFDKNIDGFVRNDPEPRGRFLRAYISTAANPSKTYNYVKLFKAFLVEVGDHPSLAGIYKDWLDLQQSKMSAPLSMKVKMIFYAIDGIWLEEGTEINMSTPEERKAFVDYLIEQTYEA